jgi:glycosyltransferase involved in cell wall biosynthesis
MESTLRGHNVLFTGFLTQDELARVYASADAFIFPSTTDTFGNVVLEAQASGLPVVVTDQGGPQELILPGESGLVVPGHDVDALVAAMRFLVEHPEQRRLMSAEARQFAVRGRLGTSIQFSTVFGATVDWTWIDGGYRAVPVDSAA